MSKTILIIISKITQLKFVELSQIPEDQLKLDNYILIANMELKDKIPKEELKYFSDIMYIPVNIINPIEVYHIESELIEIVRLICNKYSNVYAFVPDELNLELVESVLSKFNLPTWNKQTASICRDKLKMKQHMLLNGIRVPNFVHYNEELTFNILVEKLALPFVIKPTNKGGSLGVYIIKNLQEYQLFLANYDKTWDYQAEEFIKGNLYHIDTVKYANKWFITIGEYLYPMAEFLHGKLMGSREITEIDNQYSQLLEFNKKFIDSLNNNGCYHLEVFISEKGEIIFLEIAWRQAGMIASNIFYQHFGTHPTTLYIMLHLGIYINQKMNGCCKKYKLQFFVEI